MKHKLEGEIRLASCVWMLTAGMVVSSAAGAARLEQGVYLRGEYSDNVRQSANNAVDEMTMVAGYDVLYRDHTANSQTYLDAELEALYHTQGTQDDRVFGKVDASFRYIAIPNRLDWVVEDFVRSDQIDALGTSNADNRQIRNSFRFGPDFSHRFSARDELETSARVINEYEDRTEFDSNRFLLESEFSRRLNPGAVFAASYTGLLVDYDDDQVNTDFNEHDVLLEYRGEMPRGTYGMNVGASYLKRDGADGTDGLLAGAELAWQLNSLSTISAEYDQEFSDRSRDEQGATTLAGGATDRSEVFYDRRVRLTYTYRTTFTQVGVRTHARRKDFEDTATSDEDSVGVAVNFMTEVAPVTKLGVDVSHDRIDYSVSGREDEVSRLGLSLSRQVSRMMELVGRFDHNQRASTLATEEYEENRISVRLDYRL